MATMKDIGVKEMKLSYYYSLTNVCVSSQITSMTSRFVEPLAASLEIFQTYPLKMQYLKPKPRHEVKGQIMK